MNKLEKISEIQQGFDKAKEDLDTLSAIENLNQSIQNQIEEKINDLNKVVVQFNKNPEELEKNAEILANFEQELKKIQEETIKLKEKINKETKNEMSNLSEDIETNRYNWSLTTYNELIKLDSNENYGEKPLHQRLLTVMASPELANNPELKDKTPEQRVEYFFKKINNALTKFYENKLISKEWGELPEHISKALVPATEIYLLNFLRNNQHENNVGALEMAGGLSRDSINQLVEGITGIYDKYSYSYSSMKSLLNIADFLSLPQHQHYLKKLDNPYLLHQKVFVEKADIWSKKDLNIRTLSLTEAGLGFLLDQNPDETALAQEVENIKQNVKQEIQEIQMVETPETALKILWLIDKSDKILEQTGKLSNDLLNRVKKFNNIDKGLRKYLWFNFFDEIKKSKRMSGIFDFVLSLLWFSGGIKGLEAKFRRGNIENHLTSERREYISDAYKNYFDNKVSFAATEEDWQQSTNLDAHKIPQDLLKKMKEWDKKHLPKFNVDYLQLQSSIADHLDSDIDLLNTEVLASLSSNTFKGKNYLKKEKDQNGREVIKVDQNAINNDPHFKTKFINTYLANTISRISTQSDYLEKIKGPDDLAFTLISGVVIGEDNMIEWVKADAIFPSEFYETPYLNADNTPISTESSPEINPEWNSVKNKKLNNLDYSEIVIVLKSIFWEGPGTELLEKLSNGNITIIRRVIALAKHEGEFNFGRKNPDKNKGQKNIGTFQISAQPGEIVDKRNLCLDKGTQLLKENNISYSDNYFKKIINYDDETAIGSNNQEIFIKKAQTDLVVWLWYIKDRWGNDYFDKLKDPNQDEKKLMPQVQWWIDAIGVGVANNSNSSSQFLVSNSQIEDEYKNQLLA